MNQPQASVQFWIQQQTRKFESSCRLATQRVRAARTMLEVVQASHVTMPHELRAIRHTVPAYRDFESIAERRMEELLEVHLKLIRDVPTETEARELMGRFSHTDWQALRGTYAHLYRRAEQESRRLAHRKQTAETR